MCLSLEKIVAFFFNDTATTQIYTYLHTLSLHYALPISRIHFLIDKTRLLDRLRGEINERQEKALLRMFREGPDGFAGGLSAGNYRRSEEHTSELQSLMRI